MTYDQMISSGHWSGQSLKLPARMAEIVVDGVRFGTIELTTKTESENDIQLEKRIGEIHKAVMTFALMNQADVEIVSFDNDGLPLERPDLDVKFPDGSSIGLEIAEISNTNLAKHDSNRHLIEMSIRDRIDSDIAFAAKFGDYYVSLDLHGTIDNREPLDRKREAITIISEISDFIITGQHRTMKLDAYTPAPKHLKLLSDRQSMFYISRLDRGPYFSMSDGAGTIARAPQIIDTLRVLEKHRRSGANYRRRDFWLFMILTDVNEFFKETLYALAEKTFDVIPFQKLIVVDPMGRYLQLPEN